VRFASVERLADLALRARSATPALRAHAQGIDVDQLRAGWLEAPSRPSLYGELDVSNYDGGLSPRLLPPAPTDLAYDERAWATYWAGFEPDLEHDRRHDDCWG
jgi:hypothetical protein